jgi:hypothetical protein
MKLVVTIASVGPLRVMTILFSKLDLCKMNISPKLKRLFDGMEVAAVLPSNYRTE